MAMRNIHYSSIAIVVLIVSTAFMVPTRVSAIGVCYGRVGNNLPPPPEVVALFKSNQIDRMRIYEPYPDVLAALAGSNISLIVGTLNQDVQRLALDVSAAQNWVKTNILPHIGNVNFRYINIGNEIIPSDMAQFILPAMCNVQSALLANNINTIKVTTSVAMTVLGASYPPSAGDFTVAAKVIISPIVHFLAANEAPLLVNIYPYFAYKDNSKDISLDYALFKATGVIVQDGNFGYQNLFDAMLDSVNAAMEKVGGASVGVVVSESGWPSGGDFGAEVNNAGTYNQNLINHVAKGTPKKPEVAIETYLFAMFNENQKGPAELEKFFGLFFPDKTPVYPLKFT
ncbi:glucan endo-1,3-beta-glucosidase-like [Zingiber officinale]|nr:glucan endo-1,3-beta-glucosidase-like [Zingiber officinale]